MKLEIASWNDGGATYNALAEETHIISFSLTQDFDNPAECVVVLSDPTGALFQKYNVDANDVYIGPGKVELEHPTATDLFLGRVVKSSYNSKEGKTTLRCEDWMSQLAEERINYDMREPVDDAGLRQSVISSDVDGTCTPVTQTFLAYATAGDAAAYTDETTEANEDTADDMTLLPAVPAVDDAYYFGFSDTVDRVIIDISTAGVGTWTITWEYYGCVLAGDNCPGSEWLALSDVSDGTSGFTVSGANSVSFTMPAKDSHWYSCDPIGEGSAYWIRGRVSAYTDITTQPLGQQAWVRQTLYDDDIEDFTADEFNGMYLIFPAEAAGTRTITTGPYARTVAGTETAGSYADVWEDDANFHDLTRNGSTLTVDYDFHINAEMGSLYSSGPTTGKIYLTCIAYNDLQAANMKVKIKTAAEAYKTVQTIAISTTTTDIKRFTITIPTQYLTAFVDTLGEVTIQLEVEGGPGQIVYLDVYQCLMELVYVLDGTSETFLILDTTTNTLVTVANLTYKGLGIPEGHPYSIIKPIYKHIDTAESVGLSLISDEGGDESGTGPDPLMELTAAATIEHTTGMSTRNYQGRTRLEILQDLNKIDKSVMWCTLGTTIITRKSTFNAGAPTALTDATILSISSEYDYAPMRNQYDVFGVRIGDYQLHTDTSTLTPDPGADSKSTYGVTRSDIVRGTGTLSQYETDSLGTALVERDEDVRLILVVELRGLDSTYRLGTEVALTSTRIGLAAANYVVTHWAYDSATNKSTIRLHPRSSLGYQEYSGPYKAEDRLKSNIKTTKIDTYSPVLYTQEW